MPSELKRVIEAVLSCKEIMLSPFSVAEKDSASNLVTSADNAVEEKLKESLLKIFPDASFLGEESGGSGGAVYNIIVDPIDGTANFTRGLNASAISVGITKNGDGYIGVVYNPFTDELYWAEAGKGAFLNGNRISVSNRNFEHSLFYTALSLYKKELYKSCLNILDKVYPLCDDFRREGSAALELCALACGKGELYFEIRVFDWDCRGAEIILKEAGGISRRLYCNNRSDAQPFPLVAANNTENFERLLKIVEKELPQLPYNYD